MTQGLKGVALTWVKIRNGDHSASGIAPIAVLDPHAYLVDILTKLSTAKARDLDALLLWNYRAPPQPDAVV